MEELTFMILQYPISYISTGIWFSTILPLCPDWVQKYRGYSVVRTVDYLTKDSFYYISTWILYIVFLYYYTITTSDYWHVYFGFQSWIGISGMEIALQISGKRKLNFQKSAYWTTATSSYLTAFILQTLREGSVCFGLPALTVEGYFMYTTYPSIYWLAILTTLIDFGGLLHLLIHGKERLPKTLGSTNVTGRRYILDTIFYRVVEIAVIYYIYTLYPQDFYNKSKWIVWVTIYRSIQLGLFFGLGTYFGQTWIDAGPNQRCHDTWFLTIVGLLFRVTESTLSGYPKTIALTFLMIHGIEKLQQQHQ